MTDGFTVTRTFAAPPELVWAACTTPEHFSVWFGTEAVRVPLDTLTMDVRVGGALRAVMHLPDGNTIDWLGEYTEVNPPARLAFTLTDDPANPAGEPLIVDLKPVGGGTELTLHQAAEGFSQEQIDATIAGYNGFFDDMEKVLAGLV